MMPEPRSKDQLAAMDVLLMFTKLEQRIGDLERRVDKLQGEYEESLDKFMEMLNEALGINAKLEDNAKLRQQVLDELRRG